MNAESRSMLPFKSRRTVAFGDCDPGGAIYTPRACHFVVESILDFQSWILGAPAARTIFEMGILPPAKAISVEFASPLAWDDVIELEVTCSAVGETSFSCDVAARRLGGELAFRARLTQVCVSPESKRPVAIPLVLRAALERSIV
ncbi:acyl-CoA thioesterase [Hydrogenophaga sp. RWCD_12]|uniref:acyl-CoA thioesterase n=1 Tax=Hydrogenophaga sp. RWCD_12 TaxID=3391190 RepID=UPI0039853A78